jgi:hypothetical protein
MICSQEAHKPISNLKLETRTPRRYRYLKKVVGKYVLISEQPAYARVETTPAVAQSIDGSSIISRIQDRAETESFGKSCLPGTAEIEVF